MASRYVGGWDRETPSSVSATCGWCATAVEMQRIGPTVEWTRGETADLLVEVVQVLATYQCPRDVCHRPTLVAVEFYFGSGDAWSHEILGQLPRGTAQPMEGLPPEIESVRVEAWEDYYGDAYRSAVVMARAAVQRAVRTLGGEGRDLFTEIDSLLAQSKITGELKEWAHEVRLAAREAAHPEELGEVTQEEAEASLKWADAFLEFAVALPARRQ